MSKFENCLTIFSPPFYNECLLTHNQLFLCGFLDEAGHGSGNETVHHQCGCHHAYRQCSKLAFCSECRFRPAAARAEKSLIERSPNYRDGAFHNTLPTPGFTGDKNMLMAWWEFLTAKRENARPQQPLPLVPTDLASLPSEQETMIWLGHSSWYLQLAGKRILIDPVFSSYAAPFSFLNKAFDGHYPWRAETMPEIDLLIISHDHYDHLDYATIKALMPKVKRAVVPLGVGSHLRYWAWRGR